MALGAHGMPNDYSITIQSAPATYPVTVAEAKLNLRQDESADDDLITRLIGAATNEVQAFLGRSLITQTLRYKRHCFPCYFELPSPPLISVTSITYLDTAGTSQTLPTTYYAVDTDRSPGRITLKYGMSWPSTQAIENAVTVVYVAGYGAASAVPDEIKQAIHLIVEKHFERDEEQAEQLQKSAENLLWKVRNLEVA